MRRSCRLGIAGVAAATASASLQTDAAGQVVLKLKTAWRDGTTHLVMSPLEFMQRLAALELMQRLAALELMQRLASLVPRPRLHLIHWVSA